MNTDQIKPLSLELKHVRTEIQGEAIVHYVLAFQNLTAGTVVSEHFTLHVKPSSSAVSIHITGCVAPNPEQAMDKLADWMEGFALSLRQRGAPSLQFPIYK